MAFVIGVQAACAVLVILIALFFGQNAASSAALGSIVALLPNMAFALYLKINGRPSVVRLFIGEAVKLILILALSFYVWRRMDFAVSALPYWLSLVVVLKAHNLGLLRTTK